ncbi:MAG: hypothetical protein M2R46_04371 [Verrucomicrobia subdivision 3 bacterium]|nr:hypothetical protein [Limisphaerales bacterium]
MKQGTVIFEKARLEDYIVHGLIDFNDISYDNYAGLLYELAEQVVAHLHGYLKDEEKPANVLRYHQQDLVNRVHTQMQSHYIESATSYSVDVTKGSYSPGDMNCSIGGGEKWRNFREALSEGQKNRIKSMIFTGFEKCL